MNKGRNCTFDRSSAVFTQEHTDCASVKLEGLFQGKFPSTVLSPAVRIFRFLPGELDEKVAKMHLQRRAHCHHMLSSSRDSADPLCKGS